MNSNSYKEFCKQKIDSKGSAISAVRIDTEKAYSDISSLLQTYINTNDLISWKKIKEKIDYIYLNLEILLENLDKEISFKRIILSEVRQGKKILFKPNIVASISIDEFTHGASLGTAVCSEWPFLAALMRYFHDILNINYYEMCVGEASASTSMHSQRLSKLAGKLITPESIIEGKNYDFYGGWGFYFVRKYLKENHPTTHMDNPMYGYEDSINGNYLPPGKSRNKLMVYDLNNIEDKKRGRVITVPDGDNFKEITIHKSVVGGDKHERNEYPGCILINLPKLKMHAQDLITNAIKNLGIGLYPSDCLDESTSSYKYSHNPTYKSKLPHSPWVMKLDKKTLLPMKNEKNEYIRTKTLGFSGTQCDIVKSIQSQNIFMIHICDAINIINISHNPDGKCISVPEGFIFASTDPVALDTLCSRYCFNNLPMSKGKMLMKLLNWPTEFAQYVPKAYIKDNNILTEKSFDSPLFRYNLYNYAEKRDIGQKLYYVIGYDTLTQTSLASIDGHLGRLEYGKFIELITKTMYYNPSTLLHHLQETVLSYAKSCDELTGSNIYNEFMNLFDENKDGVIDYDEKGRGIETAQLAKLGQLYENMSTEEYGLLKNNFLMITYYKKYSSLNLNDKNLDFTKESTLVSLANIAYEMSKSEIISDDLFFKNMKYGQGRWPSWQTVNFVSNIQSIYGSFTIDNISFSSLYGYAFLYADKVFNNAFYTKNKKQDISDPDSIKNYFKDLEINGKLLPFILYIPKGYGSLNNINVPNVIETDDKSKIFTVHFEEIW